MRHRLALAALLIVGPLALANCRRSETPEATGPVVNTQTARGNASQPMPTPVVQPRVTYEPSAAAGMVRIDNKAYFLTPSKWIRQPGKAVTTIPVCWETGTPAGPERGWVKEAVIASWQQHSTLRFAGFVECAPNAVGARLAVRDDGADDGPHTLALGRFLDGKPSGMVLNFTFHTWSPACAANPAQRESCIRSIAVHEFGHAIGFAHEQNRPDTPGECTMKPQGTSGDVMLTPWDIHSVMNYCNPVYNNDGHLSTYDIAALNQIYGD